MKGAEPVDLRTDSEYSGRVQYHCDKNDCTLRITDLRESDSAKYKFRFITNQSGGRFTGLPGVTLTVTDLQVRRSYYPWSDELTCDSSCHIADHASYVWYKNGKKIQAERSTYSGNFDSADSYSCALKGHEHYPSPPVCVNGQSCNRVIYTNRSICAFRGSSVDISCTYSSYESITSKFWFSPERSHQWQNPSQPEDLSKDSQFARHVQVLETEKGRSTLRISDLRESDSAQYHFTFKTQSFEWRSNLPGTTLTVTDPNLQVTVSISNVYQYYTRAELKCHSRCLPDHSSFIWYKNGQKIQDVTSSTYEKYFHSADSYSCAVKGFEHHPAPSVCVHGQSCNRVIYTDRSICAFRGSSVDISCTYSSSSTYYGSITSKFWFSPGRSHQWRYSSQPEDLSKDSQYAGRVRVLETERGRSTLRISDLRESDSAQYHFTFKTQSFKWGSSLPGTTLTVTALQVQVITITVHQSYTEAKLKCLSSCSPAGRISYIWFKNGQKVMNEETSLYSGQFNPGDNVSCALKGHEDYSSPSVYAPKLPSVSVSPSGEIVQGSSVTLNCSSDANPAATYTWHKENQTLLHGPENMYHFTPISSEDSGVYHCKSENQYGQINSSYLIIDVQYAPKLPSVSMS
ncbi:basement membrane-specific heparan sulfate proteoglycan core protein-like, partial [Thunnus albacares]|uniref:basement membrane-specific heparan sulfate proteoglycan core protein-like n=1 Tax=Thunnus albacares TaxID=8236 RepID=UPI001CF71D04